MCSRVHEAGEVVWVGCGRERLGGDGRRWKLKVGPME